MPKPAIIPTKASTQETPNSEDTILETSDGSILNPETVSEPDWDALADNDDVLNDTPDEQEEIATDHATENETTEQVVETVADEELETQKAETKTSKAVDQQAKTVEDLSSEQTQTIQDLFKRLQKATQVVPAAQEAAPAQQAEAQPQPAQQTPPQPEATHEDRLQQARTAVETELTEQFKLTEEQQEQLRDNPNEVLPKMMSQMYFTVFDSLMQGINRNLPQLIQSTVVQSAQKSKAETEFYGLWPQLNRPEYRDTIDRIADVYAATNPNSDTLQRMTEIGAQAWVALKLPLEGLSQHIKLFNPGESEVATQVTRKPANPGSTPVSRRAQPTKTAWDSFVDEVAEDMD